MLLHELGIHHHAAHWPSPGSRPRSSPRSSPLHHRACAHGAALHLATHHRATCRDALRGRLEGLDLLLHQGHAVRRIGRFTDRLHARLKRGNARCGRPGLCLVHRLREGRAGMQGCTQCKDRHQSGETIKTVLFHGRSPIGCGVNPAGHGAPCHAGHLAPGCLSPA
ncbi:hypothetical protein Tharo_2419 [Thauera aromatica K172]|uniref:Uncharacterized protein n=1 Tax=Thauera aromatica K172 TaxID=44139 RepID=A0A2R4BPP5_THAAR|nr:hypothetical protein Tharo_2419 [Thauera aromatica K172]